MIIITVVTINLLIGQLRVRSYSLTKIHKLESVSKLEPRTPESHRAISGEWKNLWQEGGKMELHNV